MKEPGGLQKQVGLRKTIKNLSRTPSCVRVRPIDMSVVSFEFRNLQLLSDVTSLPFKSACCDVISCVLSHVILPCDQLVLLTHVATHETNSCDHLI